MTFSQKVIERDGGFCRLCMKPATEAHHIIHRWNKKVSNEIENGISLCCFCHRKIHDGKIKHEEIQRKMENIYGAQWWENLLEKAR